VTSWKGPPQARRLPICRRIQAAINRFLGDHNTHVRAWVADPDEIIAAVRRWHQA
jgi:hypothetical protein